MSGVSRRHFLLRSGATIVGLPLANEALLAIVPARAQEARVGQEMVRFRSEIEPVVRWIEETPREKIFDLAADELRRGLPYRELVAGLFLAGIRNIKPRPVGFKFHAVMVINSAHQLSLDASYADRLLPFFWALDNFKRSQQQDVRAGDWWLGPAREPAVPSPMEARKLFVRAMEEWDEEAADAAVIGLCRGAGPNELKESLWQYGARNYRNIGHNIIFTAQAFRTLHTIGFQHAEPVLRSLVYGILDGKRGETTAAPFEGNRKLAQTIRPDWAAGKPDLIATTSLLQTLRQAQPEEASRHAAALLNRGVAADSLWDAVLLAAGELLMRRPGVVSVHATTASNSLHYAYRASGDQTTRLLMLFQACSWLPMFRQQSNRRSRSQTSAPTIDKLEPSSPAQAMTCRDIFTEMDRDRLSAARQVMAFALNGGTAKDFMDVGRSLIFTKGTDSHHYKFSAAAFEEFLHATPVWRPHLMASSVFYLKTANDPDSPLINRTRQALARLSA